MFERDGQGSGRGRHELTWPEETGGKAKNSARAAADQGEVTGSIGPAGQPYRGRARSHELKFGLNEDTDRRARVRNKCGGIVIRALTSARLLDSIWEDQLCEVGSPSWNSPIVGSFSHAFLLL